MEENRKSLYEDLGGEKFFQELTEKFYFFMDSNPEFKEIRVMHPQNLDESKEKLFLFLCGWSGGPPLYVQKYGHPRLRARHFPFPIGTKERDQWLNCMSLALENLKVEEILKKDLMSAFNHVADFMRNKQD